MEIPTLDQMPEVLLPEEVAAVLRVSRATVYELVRRGKLPAKRVGRGRQGGVRVTRAALRAYLEADE
jgi:putative molybdopterin biosynthesis protein